MVGFHSEEKRAFLAPRPPGVTRCPGKTSSPATLDLYLGETRLVSGGLNLLQRHQNHSKMANSMGNKHSRHSKANKVNKAWNKFGWTEGRNSTETIPSGMPF